MLKYRSILYTEWFGVTPYLTHIWEYCYSFSGGNWQYTLLHSKFFSVPPGKIP